MELEKAAACKVQTARWLAQPRGPEHLRLFTIYGERCFISFEAGQISDVLRVQAEF